MYRTDDHGTGARIAGRGGVSARAVRIGSWRELVEHWREDFAVNGRGLFVPGFQAVAVYRFGVWAHGLNSRLVRGPLRALYRVLYVFVRNVYGIEIPHTVRAGRRLRLGHQNGIVIHRWVTLGHDCLVRHNVTIGVSRGSTPREEAPVIGDRVAIGAGAVILSPARIGDDVLIGPNVVVRSTVPSCTTVMPHAPETRERRGVIRPEVELAV